jgi:UDP-glucose 4-epimerase
MSTSVLVVGGAGYIASHMVKMLMKEGHHVTVFDNLSRGYRDAVMTNNIIAIPQKKILKNG